MPCLELPDVVLESHEDPDCGRHLGLKKAIYVSFSGSFYPGRSRVGQKYSIFSVGTTFPVNIPSLCALVTGDWLTSNMMSSTSRKYEDLNNSLRVNDRNYFARACCNASNTSTSICASTLSGSEPLPDATLLASWRFARTACRIINL